MQVKILEVSTDDLIDAVIKEGRGMKLPSIQTGWRFNFGSRLKELPYATAYVLVCEETPDIIEGCLIFQMKDKTVPYMAYVEIAPHNRTDPKKHDFVGGCLIAYACMQSFAEGRGDHYGWLAFDIHEEDAKDRFKLMRHYSSRYNAQRLANTTTMWINPNHGQVLIEEYLDRKDEGLE
jgi:hypothetical protein